jgi:hypothetical protein
MGIAYDPTKPAANDKPANDQPIMQTNFASIKTLIDVDHVDFSNAQYGQHNQVTFATISPPNPPTPPVTPPQLFTNTQDGAGNNLPAGLAQLFFYSGDASHSKNQYTSSNNGSVILTGGIILKWGTASGVTNGSTVNFVSAFPNNCFGVQVTLNIASSLVGIGINGFNQTDFTFRSIQFNGSAASGVPITYVAIGN